VSTTPSSAVELADLLWRAEIDRRAIDPITDGFPRFGSVEAYEVQTVNIERRVAAGATIRGRKVGLTSRSSQRLLGVSEPNYGVLLSDMFVDDGDEIPLRMLIQPRVEAELAFVMADDLAGPGVTTVNALMAIGAVLPAIEVVDSRISDWRIRIGDTVADNASSARVVVGSRAVPAMSIDLCHLGVLFYRNGSPVESGAGAAVLGNPARCVAWLANTLGSLGSGLRRGDVVLSGALHRMVPVRAGDSFRAEFAHLGGVSVSFDMGSA
jgi:2-keto-4-pentenoate hydratase